MSLKRDHDKWKGKTHSEHGHCTAMLISGVAKRACDRKYHWRVRIIIMLNISWTAMTLWINDYICCSFASVFFSHTFFLFSLFLFLPRSLSPLTFLTAVPIDSCKCPTITVQTSIIWLLEGNYERNVEFLSRIMYICWNYLLHPMHTQSNKIQFRSTFLPDCFLHRPELFNLDLSTLSVAVRIASCLACSEYGWKEIAQRIALSYRESIWLRLSLNK